MLLWGAMRYAISLFQLSQAVVLITSIHYYQHLYAYGIQVI